MAYRDAVNLGEQSVEGVSFARYRQRGSAIEVCLHQFLVGPVRNRRGLGRS